MSRDATILHTERMVLRTAMERPAALTDLPLKPFHFASEQHGDVWATLTDLAKEGKPTDGISVADALERDGRRAIATLALEISCSGDLYGVSNPSYYAETMADAWRNREALAIAAELQRGAKQREDGAVDRAIAALTALPERSETVRRCPSLLRAVPLEDVMAAQTGPWPHVVEFYLPRRVVTLLGGHGGVGKSMLALIIAAHVASGCPWDGLRVEPCRVAFLSFEDEGDVLQGRLRRIIEAYGLPAQTVIANLTILDGSDADTELALESDDRRGLEFTAMMGAVTDAVAGAGLVFIDNSSDTYGANENDRRQVKQFIKRLALEAKRNNSAVVLLAHVDKHAAKGSGKGNNYSGSTAWHNSVRSRLALIEDEGFIELLHEKANYGAKREPSSFTRGPTGVLTPMPAAAAAAAKAQAAATLAQGDSEDVLRVFEVLLSSGLTIPTAETGQRTTYHVLSRAPELPAHLKGAGGKERIKVAVMALERDGQIQREAYTSTDRKPRERWALAQKSRPRSA